MNLAEIKEKLELDLLTGPDGLDREVAGGYSGDLLSDVMGNSEPGQVWITIQTHVNIAAVASLRELAGIILAGGREPSPEALAKGRGRKRNSDPGRPAAGL